MSKTIMSGSLTFIDNTDNRKLEVHISSNLPTTQIYNANEATYTPDWTSTNLELTHNVYLDSVDITSDTQTSRIWYKQIGTGEKTRVSSNRTLVVSTNDLSVGAGIITYICEATYQDITAEGRITFTRVDTGLNGSDGNDAPAVQAQYSVDGSAWTSTLNAATHKYIRHSYDGGKTWTTAIKMVGEDGTSVRIKGTATSATSVTGTDYYTLIYSGSSITGAELGDAYLYNGDLYVCANSRDGADYFINVGAIQGPAGNDGLSSYVFIRYATDANGTSMSTNPSGKTYMGVATSNTNVAPTTANSYTWSKFVGDNAKSIVLSGDSQVFKVSTSNVYMPATIKVTAQAFNTSVTTWTYSTNGGQTFVATAPTGVVRNGNVVTITGSTLTTNSIVVKASDGLVEDVFTVYKAFDGTNGNPGAPGTPASMAFLTNENVTFGANASGQILATSFSTNVVAYNGTTKITPTIGTISGLPTGMTAVVGTAVNNEIPIVFTIQNNATLGSALNNNGSITIPINGPVYTNLILSWSKVNAGATGTSASLVTITPSALYFKSTTGKDGTFDPEFIYLYPRFQNATYNGWQYSTDGGANWINASTSNGLSIDAHNGVTNSLRIIRSSSLYTDNVTSISFRCNTLDPNIYDVVSIAKIYDVADFKIGGRNYILNSADLSVSGLGSSDGSRMEYKYIDVGQSYMDIPHNTEVTISFDLEMTVGTENPTLMVYNTNRRGPKTFAAKTIRFPAAVGDVIKQRCSVVANLIDFETPDRTTNAIEFYSTYETSNWFKISNLKLEKGNQPTDWTPAPEDLIESAANVNVMLSNEAHFFTADYNGIPSASNIVLDVIGYKGSIRSVTAVGAIGGLPSKGMTAVISDNNTANAKVTISVTSELTSAIADSGTLTIPVTVNGHLINKKFSWVKSKAGIPGGSASLVTINPSALYFKSNMGKDGTFTPDYIFLYPKFQNVSYRSWEYSTDGGTTWTATTGVNGLSVVTRNGIGNVLRVANNSTIYTDTITSVSFRCNSSDTTVYDVVSIAKIYDVVDLQIGGRNLLTNSGYMKTLDGWKNYAANSVVQDLKIEPNDVYGNVLTVTGTEESSRIRVGKYIPYLQKANRTLIFSMVYSASLDPTTVTMGGKYSELDLTGEYGQFYGGTVKRIDLGNGFTYMECPVNLTYTEATRSFFVYIYPRVQTVKIVWCKLEEGNKATDWSPAPEDLDVSIGGRNLLLKTDKTEKTLTITATNQFGTISQFVPSAKQWRTGYVDIAEYGLSIGETVTFQAYIIPQNNLPLAVRVWGGNNGTNGTPITDGNYIAVPGVSSCTFTIAHRYIYLGIVCQNTITSNITEKYSSCKLERGNKATDWSPAAEDLIEEASNSTVMLSNEAHIFEADLDGVAIPATIVLDVIGFKGATQTATTVGSITGIPSTGMAVSTSNNNTTNTKITISVTRNLTAAIADYGTLTIPITVNGYTINKVFSWAKSNDMSNLNIGGRNLLYDSTFNEGLVWPQVRGTIIPAEPDKPNSKIYHVLHTNESTTTATSSPIVNNRRIYLELKQGESLTISYDFYTEDLEKVGNTVATLRVADNETTSTMTSLYNHSKTQLINAGVIGGKWQRVSFVYTATNDVSGWFVFGLYARTEIGTTIDYKYREIKVEKGNKATDWTPAVEDMVGVTFQLYTPKGYLLTNDIPELTIETFAYEGSQTVQGATFAWYNWNGEEWVAINGATNTSLTVNKTDVLKSGVYKCVMTYRNKIYEATTTIEDKTDIYESLVRVTSKYSPNNKMYWILYATVYSEEGERDALLGPVSETAPANPTTGVYWYKIDETNYTVSLMKYSGTAWVSTTDTQELIYDWFLFRDVTDMVTLGAQSKVKIVTASDFSRVCNVQCNVSDPSLVLLSRNNQTLNDPSDPVVSDTAPENPIDGQLWIRTNPNGAYMLLVWNSSTNDWIVSEADSQKKVYVSRPEQYNEGDIWIVDAGYEPDAYVNGVLQTEIVNGVTKNIKHLAGTMLRAQYGSQTYKDIDWVEALNYKKELDDIKENIDTYNQFFTFDDTGMTMRAKNLNGQISMFSTKLTNTELGFYQGENKVAYINNNQLNISKAEITDGMVIGGNAPILQIGNFAIIQESNGSLSIGLKS